MKIKFPPDATNEQKKATLKNRLRDEVKLFHGI